MPELPKWKKLSCVHCAAGMDMSAAAQYHWTGKISSLTKCQAPKPEAYIAQLEQKLAEAEKDTKRLEAMVANEWTVSSYSFGRPPTYGIWRGYQRITASNEYPEDWRKALDDAMEQPK